MNTEVGCTYIEFDILNAIAMYFSRFKVAVQKYCEKMVKKESNGTDFAAFDDCCSSFRDSREIPSINTHTCIYITFFVQNSKNLKNSSFQLFCKK